MKLNSKNCTLEKLDELFGLEQLRQMPVLTAWLECQTDISDYERQTLEHLQVQLLDRVHDWNETELSMGFISPLMSVVGYFEKEFNFFAQRPFSGKIGDVELSGKPDGVIASGKHSPDKPYFCFQEYKQENDPEGDPAGQVLGAMLVAQELNEHEHPIYGCYVKGSIWYFLVLQGKEYSISPPYVAVREDIFTILSILKVLKPIIRVFVRMSTTS